MKGGEAMRSQWDENSDSYAPSFHDIRETPKNACSEANNKSQDSFYLMISVVRRHLSKWIRFRIKCSLIGMRVLNLVLARRVTEKAALAENVLEGNDLSRFGILWLF